MPRPKIRPEDRQRAYKACDSCKALKKRCDSQLPCAMCIRRECASTCAYQASTSRRRLTHPTVAVQPQQAIPIPSAAPVSSEMGDCAVDDGASPPISFESENTSSSAPQRTEARMLLSSKGERVYVGGTASLSFLHFLRQVLRQHMGPSSFTEHERRHFMLEANTDSLASEPLEESASEKNNLIESYFSATSGLLYLFTREEMADMQRRSASAENIDRDEFAAICLAIAIGGQCRGSSRSDLQYAAQYFVKGQQFAFEGMLQDPSLNMIRLFLQMAFYMLGACRRNTAFMYIGVASKAAYALGLHVTERQGFFNENDRSKRLRIWKSLRILDLLVTAILGRPCASSLIGFESAPAEIASNESNSTKHCAFEATFDACVLIETMMQNMGKNSRVEAEYAELFLQQLGKWSSSLPRELREFRRSSVPLDSMSQELVIGSTHNSCVYYFAVMLITRPFLISYLMPRLAMRTQQNADLGRDAQDNSQNARLAQACIDAAMFMAQICHDASRSNLLLNNMCILKAWIFAAGLVLGFAIFAEGVVSWEKETAFTKTREVLEKLSELSPQAAHYHDILTTFSDAISKHRSDVSRKNRGSSKQFVNEIFTLNLTDQDTDLQHYATPSSRGTGSLEAEGSAEQSLRSFEPYSMISQVDGANDYNTYDWDEFTMQMSEGFSFDVEPLGLFFDSI